MTNFFFFGKKKEDKFELRITKLMRINFAAAGNRTRDLQISESERENDRIKGWVAHNRAPNHAPWLVAPSLACSGHYFSHCAALNFNISDLFTLFEYEICVQISRHITRTEVICKAFVRSLNLAKSRKRQKSQQHQIFFPLRY